MAFSERSNRVLLVGLWISLSGHIFFAMGFVRYGPDLVSDQLTRVSKRTETPAHKPTTEEPEKLPRTIRLGLAKSEANTLTWLGFEEATEHAAPVGMVEQSQMTLQPAGPQARPERAAGGPVEPSPPQAAPSPPSPPDLLQQPQQRQAADAAAAMAELRQRAAELSQELVSASPNPAKTEPGQRTPEPPKPQPAAPPTPPIPTAQPTPQTPPATAPGEGGGLPGIQSDKESTAVAIKQAPTVRPGQVAAAQGLEIKTRVPRWTITTLMTLKPRNPTVLITFRRDCTVRNVEFARAGGMEYSTGHESWDQPLLNAIYGWTASGKPLSELDPSDSEAGLTILMTVLLPR